MAKIKFGMMMTDARGKLGGQVFSKNKSGSYVRTKVTPTNPRTAKQMASRSILGTLSAGWNALTLAQVTAWNKAVDQWAKTDIFGDLKNPTGKNLFVSLNKNLLGIGEDVINLPPNKQEMLDLSALAVTYDAVANEFTVTGLQASGTGYYQVMASPVVPTGVNYVKNKLRVVGRALSTETTASVLDDNYTATFGSAPIANRVFVQIRFIGLNGQAGAPVMVRVTATTP